MVLDTFDRLKNGDEPELNSNRCPDAPNVYHEYAEALPESFTPKFATPPALTVIDEGGTKTVNGFTTPALTPVAAPHDVTKNLIDRVDFNVLTVNIN